MSIGLVWSGGGKILLLIKAFDKIRQDFKHFQKITSEYLAVASLQSSRLRPQLTNQMLGSK